jgi:hypothetical protein
MKPIKELIKENRVAWLACGGAEREACGLSLPEEQKAQAEAYLKIPKRMRKGSKTK